MECLENGGKFYFLNIWQYLKELHMGQSTQRLERKKQSVLRVSLYKTGEDIQRPISPVCSHCSLFLMLVLPAVLPSHAGRKLRLAALRTANRPGGRAGKNLLSWALHMPCCFLCVCQRSHRSEFGIAWVLPSTPFDNSCTNHIQKNPANYWKQHILKGSYKTISQDLYSL